MNIEKISKVIDLGSKIAAAAVAASYLVGLLVVNIYLWGVGSSEFSLLKVRFLYTGTIVLLWFLSSIIGLILVFNVLLMPTDEAEVPLRFLRPLQNLIQKSPAARLMEISLISAFALVFPLYWGNRILSGHLWPVHWSLILVLFPAYLKMLFAALLVVFSYLVSIGRLDKPLLVLSEADRRVYVIVLLLGATVQFGRYLEKFAHEVYPVLAEQAGGGRPREVQLLFSATGSAELPLSSFARCGSGWSEKVTLIFDGDNDVVLRTQSGQIIQLKKDMIVATRSTPVDCSH